MTPQEEGLVEQLKLFEAALYAFGEAVGGVGRVFRRFCRQVSVAHARTPRERRRLIRDWQRHNRRPALIHNGGKPR